MRNNPSDSASIIGRLNHGANVTITGESGDWYKIESGSLKGYASKEFITIISYAEERLGTVTGASSLKVRSGPGTSYSRITAISGGSTVTVLGETNGWYMVRLNNGTTGYCSAQYITLRDSGPDPSDPDADTGIVTGTQSVNVRSGASETSGVLFTVSPGTKVTILEKTSNGWYKIQVLNKTGYISAQYITLESPSASPSAGASSPASTPASTPTGTPEPTQSPQPSNKTGTVKLENSSSRLNVRSGPGTSYSVVASLSNNAKVTVLKKESNGWYYIRTASGKTGYVSGEYIKLDGSQSSQAPSESRQGKVKLSSSSSRLNVRSNASMSAGIIGKLSDGAAVSILGESGDWYKIKYNQTTGYVSKEFIQI